jgi:Fe-S-cluster-containing hydrogenase component 2
MPSDVYRKLREQMDEYSVGFPETDSGVEYKILKRLFNEDEANTYLAMSMMSEPAQAIASRVGEEEAAVAERLERMVEKGLIFKVSKKGSVKYGAAPFVVGSYEYQVRDMDKEFAQLFEQYFTEAFGPKAMGETPLMRTIPVNKSIDHSWAVAPYEDLREIVRNRDKIAVANCVCRVQQGLVENPCDKPLEVCLTFGSHAQYYVDKKMGRWISTDEALKILDECDEAGLVPQPFNDQNPGGLCNCCGDCCGILRALKMQEKPAHKALTNYYAKVDPDLCSECETCVERCQMDAITMENGPAEVIMDRCIGCGLCVTTCPGEAIILKRKPETETRLPPGNAYETIMKIAQERGKSLIPLSMVKDHK